MEPATVSARLLPRPEAIHRQATAVLLQDRALKGKRETGLTRLLPALADAERLEVGLLRWSVLVMAAGLMTGMAVQYLSSGLLLILDHKILLSFLAFGVLLLLLGFHHLTGLRDGFGYKLEFRLTRLRQTKIDNLGDVTFISRCDQDV